MKTPRLLILPLFLGAFAFASIAPAATITVNSTADVAADDGQCTLREAITSANTDTVSGAQPGECVAGSGSDTIQFNIGSGTPSIALTSGLPGITTVIDIEGATGGATRVELNGAGSGGATGLSFSGGGSAGSTVRNLVINRFGTGIDLNQTTDITIQGNFIGTNAAGTASSGNTTGIHFESSPSNTIGGTTGTTPGGSCTGACNVISSNSDGLFLEQNSPSGSDSNTIQGNFIGTDVTGTVALGNNMGIRTFNTAHNNQIGGSTVAARNLISGNNIGIGIFGGLSSGTTIKGNFIGTNSAGTAILGNTYGVRFVVNTTNITIGGSNPGEGNVISGNSTAGIYGGESGGTIQGNFIGTDLTGTLQLANGYGNPNLEAIGGISLLSGASGNTIGGLTPGMGNIIAFNEGAGIRLGSINSTGAAGGGNLIEGNSIYRNNGPGISLNNGTNHNLTPLNNDVGDADTGPNNRQNYPILNSVSEAAGMITVNGIFNSLASTTFALNFYVSQDADPSGNGEGQKYVGTQSITTDVNGNATVSFSYPTQPGMPYTTATATDTMAPGTNDTSEFSNAILVANPGQFVFSSPTYSIVESGGTATITVNRINGSAGPACVNYATSDGTANAGPDYVAAAGQLCFADGETSKTFTVTIVSDTIPEADETINLTLSIPTNGSSVGFQGTATLTIINDDSFVTFVVNSTADTDDGQCAPVGTGNGCTLREAINAANATPQQDSIVFDIGSGNPTITVTSALPTITAPVIIDGSAGPGGATRVEINGNNINASGLSLNSAASRSVIRRLVINRFNNSGIDLADSSNNVIEANYIGTDSTGTIARGNGGGINFTSANNNLIGGTMGTTPGGGCSGACNLISGNGGAGINSDPQGGSANGNIIQGNFIGTDVTGTVALGNGGRGITFLNAVNTTQIGGNSPNARNLISGNANDIGIFLSAAGTHDNVIQGNYIGVNTSATAKIPNAIGVMLFFTATNNSILNNVISGNSENGVEITTNGGPPSFPPHDNIVRGNFIGTDPTGTLDLGNGTAGFPGAIPVGGVVLDQGVFNNQIGGTAAGDANVIAFNYGVGIRLGAFTGAVAAGTGNSLLNNSIYSNDGLGIALGDGDGKLTVPLVNDINDPDTGANNRQNYPMLANPPTSSGGMVTVGGTLNSVANTSFTIQFFVSSSPDALSSNGEGQTFVGSVPVMTTGNNTSISFTYTARIGKQYITATATDTATGDTSEFSNFVVDPTPQSNPPVVTANDASGNPNQPITVTASFTDSDGTPPYTASIDCGNSTMASSVMVNAGATSGTVSGVCTYTAPGMYTATVTVSDSAGIPGSDTSTVTVNAPPVASNGNVTTNEDTSVSGNLSANDPDGGTLTYSIVSNPTLGTLSAFNSATGSFTYTPNANANGSDSFTFKVNDGQADSNTATESITINPVNDPPTANGQSVTTNEDTAKPITLTGSDIDGDPLTFSVVTGPAHGTLTGTAPNLTYTPNANYNGADSFTFKTNDGQADSAPATVSITVTAVNDPPTANGQSVTTNEDTAKPITLTGSDVDGDTLTFSVVSGPAHGVLTGTAPNLTYTPNANYNGADSFTFKANDGQADSAPATVSITIVAVNDAPSFVKGPNQTVNQGAGPQSVPNWATNISAGPPDESGQTLTFMVSNNNTALFSSQPAVSSTGTLTYTPAANANGSATVTVVLMDSGGTANGGQDTSAPQTFTITVVAPTPTPTPTATATATPTATATATATATVAPSPTPSPTPKGNPSPAQTLNISSRLRVDTGDNVMIAGFIITGNASKPVVIRGMGPSLTASQIPADKVLLDPVIELHGPNGALITSNDNWKDSPQRSQIEGTPFQPTDDREAVILATLQPGPYTAIISGKNGTTGIGLIEVYDNNQAVDSTLANLSTRGFVMIQENVIIGGFMLGNNPSNTRIAIRGLGPSLASSGLTNLLADPTLTLHDANGTVLVSNDNWQDDPVSAALLTANGLAPHDIHEAGIFTILPAGSFTAILAGQPPGTGIGLIEIYNLQ